MKPIGFYHVSLFTRSYDRSKQFYLALGCQIDAEWTEATIDGQTVPFRGALLNTGNGTYFELNDAPPDYGEQQSPIAHHFSLEVQDVRAALSHALANGAEIARLHPEAGDSPKQVCAGGMRSLVCFVRAPGGETLALLQRLENS